jgi:hypothetical protein
MTHFNKQAVRHKLYQKVEVIHYMTSERLKITMCVRVLQLLVLIIPCILIINHTDYARARCVTVMKATAENVDLLTSAVLQF